MSLNYTDLPYLERGLGISSLCVPPTSQFAISQPLFSPIVLTALYSLFIYLMFRKNHCTSTWLHGFM